MRNTGTEHDAGHLPGCPASSGMAGRRHRNPSKINLGHTGEVRNQGRDKCATVRNVLRHGPCIVCAITQECTMDQDAQITEITHARKQRNTKGTQKDGILCIKRNGQAAYIEYNALFGIEYFPSIEGGLEQIQCRSGDSSITVEGHNLGPTSKTSRPSSATPSAKPTTPNRPLLSACLTSRPSPFASGSNPAATMMNLPLNQGVTTERKLGQTCPLSGA